MSSVRVRNGLPLVMKVRILEPCGIRGTGALEGDEWLLARAEALTLLDAGQAERITSEDEPVELREPIEIYSEGPDDPAPRLVKRIPENERKQRPRIEMPQNLAV